MAAIAEAQLVARYFGSRVFAAVSTKASTASAQALGRTAGKPEMRNVAASDLVSRAPAAAARSPAPAAEAADAARAYALFGKRFQYSA